MSDRRDEVFHVLKVIQRTVAVTQEAIDAAIKEPERDRELVMALRAQCLGGKHAVDLDSFVETIESAVGMLHTVCQSLISERETLGKALDHIRRDLDHAGISPRTRNVGQGGRRTKATT